MSKDNKNRCSFCGRTESEVPMMLIGNDGCICSDCVQQATEVVRQNGIATAPAKPGAAAKSGATPSLKDIPRPQEIKAYLDQYVIGQDDAKRTLAVAVYNHYKRLQTANSLPGGPDDDGVELEKSNIVMLGPTGTGKTLLVRSIARLLNVPFTIVDATVFTEAGYVGEDVESILSRLLQVCDYDEGRAAQGIVFIDEIDKIARKQDNPSLSREVGGEGVQQSLLKLLEGSVVNVPPKGGRKHPDQEYVHLDTREILFICGGAFEGIERRIARRLGSRTVGYNSLRHTARYDNADLLRYVEPQDLRSFGLIPELVGRLPVITSLQPLGREMLREILLTPRNSIVKQYTKILAIDGVELTFEDAALDYIVEQAMQYKLGARGLRSITERIMNEAMYDAPNPEEGNRHLVITADYCRRQTDKFRPPTEE
ncbi:MAG: ATP-dependent Clp protease ATP-binding subunit ClpX [Bacteroidaceae bacterium]|nr:ATP-dependent Clp protease ATP-binding subunit ClpX [Bacteroidaceae bacterium]